VNIIKLNDKQHVSHSFTLSIPTKNEPVRILRGSIFNQSKELTSILNAGFNEIEPVQRYGLGFKSVRREESDLSSLDREQRIIQNELRKREEKERKYKEALGEILNKVPGEPSLVQDKVKVDTPNKDVAMKEDEVNMKSKEKSRQVERAKSHGIKKKKKASIMDRELEQEIKESMERMKKLRSMAKESYNHYVQEKKVKDEAKKQQHRKEVEERLKKGEEEMKKLLEEKKLNKEKKRQFNDSLKIQIQEKDEKKRAEKAMTREDVKSSSSVIGVVDHDRELLEKEKRGAQQCKTENLVLMKQRKEEKAKKKNQERAIDEEYLNHEKALEKERIKIKLQKREEQRKDMQESSDHKQKKQIDNEDILTREYYDKLNQDGIRHLKQEKVKQREIMNKYRSALSDQIKQTEEQKKKAYEIETKNDKKLEGIPLECYKSARFRDESKRKYFQELKKQYEDSVPKKKQKEVIEPYNMTIEHVTPEQEAEELRKKKVIQKNDYLNSMKELDEKRQFKKAKKAEELKNRLNDLEKFKEDTKIDKVKQREAKKRLAEELEKQSVIDIIKKKMNHADRYDWDEDVTAKYAETIENKINALKNEIRTNTARKGSKAS